MNISYSNTLEQKQLLSQTQIQSLQILSMDNCELNDFLQTEYLENPMLDCAGSKEPSAEAASEPTEQAEFSQWYDKNIVSSGDYGSESNAEDTEGRREIPAENTNSLQEYLLSQLNQWCYTKKEWELIQFMIDCLDHNGFLTATSAEIAHLTNMDKAVVEKCLADLEMLEPYGIFAKDLSHCLIRQMEIEGLEDENMTSIILYHLNDVADGKISSISRDLKLTTAQVRQYISLISQLNPRPLAGFDLGKTEYIVPDIIFRYKDNQWEIELNDNWIGDYKLSDYYMKLMKTAKDPELFEYFKGKLERVRFIMSSIEQRRTTMMNISKAILEWQRSFFLDQGPLKPMTLSDIADKIEMHTSTVSRGIKNKYLQYPNGTVSIRSLFSSAVSSGNQGSEEGMTAIQVKEVIRSLIHSENKEKPFSDNALVKLLEEKDIHISRRTIAKYREELGIKGTFERKSI